MTTKKPKRRKGESRENFRFRLQIYNQRFRHFDPEEQPRLISNEKRTSFKDRVKSWEAATGKKYKPKSLKETKMLSNRAQLGKTFEAIGRTEDFSREYRSEITEYQKEKFNAPYAGLSKEARDEAILADIASGKIDASQIKLPDQTSTEDLRINQIIKANKERETRKRTAENKRISEGIALSRRVDPWSMENVNRAAGLEISRTDNPNLSSKEQQDNERMALTIDKTIEQKNVDIIMKNNKRSGTPLPADKVWEQNYGKKWALMTKQERKAAKRDLRISAGE